MEVVNEPKPETYQYKDTEYDNTDGYYDRSANH